MFTLKPLYITYCENNSLILLIFQLVIYSMVAFKCDRLWTWTWRKRKRVTTGKRAKLAKQMILMYLIGISLTQLEKWELWFHIIPLHLITNTHGNLKVWQRIIFYFLTSINGLKFLDTCNKAKFKNTVIFVKDRVLVWMLI